MKLSLLPVAGLVAALSFVATAADDSEKSLPGTKAITQINTGAGLTGGPITTTGTISVATGGITSSMILDGAVGAADVDSSVVQRRIGTVCATGFAISSVTATGDAVCTPTGRTLAQLAKDGGVAPAIVYPKPFGSPTGFPFVGYSNTLISRFEVVRCTDDACTSTTTATNPDSTASTISDVRGVASGSFVAFAYRATVSGVSQIRLTTCQNGDCTSSTSSLVENNTQSGTSIGLALGADGFPILSYFSDLNQLRVAKCSNASCTSSTKTNVDTGTNAGVDSDVEINASGLPVIAYSNDVDVKIAYCGNASCSSGNTLTTAVTGVGGYDTQLVLANGVSPVVAFLRWTSPTRTQIYSDAAGAVFTVEDGQALNYSFAIGSDGAPVLSYRFIADNTTSLIANDLRVARCNGVRCNTGITVTSAQAGIARADTSLAIAPEGTPMIAFTRAGSPFTVGVHRCAGPTCF